MRLVDLGSKAFQLLSPERAHNATLRALATGLGPRACLAPDPRLKIQVAGLDFDNPIGLAAGFDKNAEVIRPMLALGFGFVEVGAVTPRPQPGNDRPRVFRLPADQAVINRYGFNNDGLDVVARRLRRAAGRRGVVGVNLGANKDSEDRIADYVKGVVALEGLVDFYTVNISSPNTPGLRALQDKQSLASLLDQVIVARDGLAKPAPVFLKIAPDLTDEDKADIADVVRAAEIDGLIVSHTTIARPDRLVGRHAGEKGGLSGAPLFEPSTRLLGEMRRALGASTPLVGVGGVSSAADAYAKIRAGASLVQLYTALVYKGPGLAQDIVRGLAARLQSDGFDAVADAVGADID